MTEVNLHRQNGAEQNVTSARTAIILSPLRLTRVFEGSLEQLSEIRAFVGKAAHSLGGSEDDAFACELACDEAAANIFNHAFESRHGRITLTLWREETKLVLKTHYHGRS